ncbi:hypothetical protein VTJ83DRAFT_4568 [Remersonia thermophila]|uniref:HTH APSES-type domain-containing protein n=1 Tax=Remersonia thermophila TaxID=72144 RepID=A0ABR4DBT7_9PEZI
MTRSRSLPERRNHLLLENIPSHGELVARRRLGQTQLTARMVASSPGGEVVDTSSLGAFDYAHLRAPLPKGIVSGIFKPSPASYFLMRRSQDGYVSATGMFKATFPYAAAEEEEAERKYIKSLPTTSPEETAGNIWIPPEQALILAEEYQILPWIRALLDPAEIVPNSSADPKKITAPPKFYAPEHALPPPTPSATRTSSRTRRSVSPVKSLSKRAIATPRKRRTASSQSSVATTDSTSPTLVNGDAPSQTLSEEGDVKVDSVEKEHPAALETVEEEPKIKVHVDQDVKVDQDGEEVKHTKVDVEVPIVGELPSREDAARMIAEAKAMVEAAVEADKEASGAAAVPEGKGKRKADDIAQDEEEKEGEEEADASRATKKVKTEAEIRKEKIRKRAFFGLTATVAVGAFGALLPVVGPYIFGGSL